MGDTPRCLRLALRAAPFGPGSYLTGHDLRLVDADSGRHVDISAVELLAEGDEFVTAKVTLLLHGVDIDGMAIVRAQRRAPSILRRVRLRARTDRAAPLLGCDLEVTDAATGRPIADRRLEFSWRYQDAPRFVVEPATIPRGLPGDPLGTEELERLGGIE